MSLLFLDFESFIDRKNGYHMGKGGMPMVEYIRDKRFKAHGLGWALDDGPIQWVPGPQIPEWAKQFDWTTTSIVAHGTKFDGSVAAWIYGIKPRMFVDTISMSRAVLGDSMPDHSLRTLAEHFKFPEKLEMKTDGIRDLTPEQEKELAVYCCRDVEIDRMLFNQLKPDFPKNQYWHVDWTIRAYVYPRLILDSQRLVELSEEEGARKAAVLERLGVEKTALMSNKRLEEMLKAKGFAVRYKRSARTNKMIPAFGKGDHGMATMLRDAPDDVKDILNARLAVKSSIIETRAAKLAGIGSTGTLPYDVGFSCAMRTHRYGGEGGTNVQNLPKESVMRECVMAPDGFSLVVGDFDKVECRIVAFMANEKKLIEGLRGDVYSAFASKLYKRPITKADKRERQFGKCSVLGLNYQMWVDRFIDEVRKQTGVVLTGAQAKEIILFYRNEYANIPRLWDLLLNFLGKLTTDTTGPIPFLPFLSYEKEAVVLPSGLKIRYPELKACENSERLQYLYKRYKKTRGEKKEDGIYGGKVLENLSQGLAGELCKTAIRTLETREHIPCVGQLHDEILAIVPTAEADKAAETMRRVMGESPTWFPTLELKAEVGIGKSWAEAKKNAK